MKTAYKVLLLGTALAFGMFSLIVLGLVYFYGDDWDAKTAAPLFLLTGVVAARFARSHYER